MRVGRRMGQFRKSAFAMRLYFLMSNKEVSQALSGKLVVVITVSVCHKM